MCLTDNALSSGWKPRREMEVCISVVIVPEVGAVITGRDSQRVNKSSDQVWRGCQSAGVIDRRD